MIWWKGRIFHYSAAFRYNWSLECMFSQSVHSTGHYVESCRELITLFICVRTVVIFHSYLNCWSSLSPFAPQHNDIGFILFFIWFLSYFLCEFSSAGPDGLSEGDWTCPKCDNINFSFRNTCNMKKCGAPRPTPVSMIITMVNTTTNFYFLKNVLCFTVVFSCVTVWINSVDHYELKVYSFKHCAN